MNNFNEKAGFTRSVADLIRNYYKYTPPRPLEKIETDLKQIEKEIADMLVEVTE